MMNMTKNSMVSSWGRSSVRRIAVGSLVGLILATPAAAIAAPVPQLPAQQVAAHAAAHEYSRVEAIVQEKGLAERVEEKKAEVQAAWQKLRDLAQGIDELRARKESAEARVQVVVEEQEAVERELDTARGRLGIVQQRLEHAGEKMVSEHPDVTQARRRVQLAEKSVENAKARSDKALSDAIAAQKAFEDGIASAEQGAKETRLTDLLAELKKLKKDLQASDR
ncbi:hypothetical protein M3T53_07720 [Actinomyces sp. B33]|uniref:hypothetical protein n=1 Tax=Actinomyces sp. B33 TaxID=2942131 RepID=UPI0023406A2F|nr:hypothetical protein [Actinomyces sp. B33]MDC4233590.1 hypothetical protein [Actinomyces sp. B33]